MKFKQKKEKTILKRLITPMLFVVAIQSLVFIVAIFSLSTVEKLESNATSLFMEMVNSRKNNIESDMVHNWTNLKNFSDIVEKYCNSVVENGTEITKPMVESLLEFLRYSKVTGAFLILDEQGASENGYKSFYLRDLDPSNASSDNSDILVEVGNSKIIKEMKLTMDSNWNTKLYLSEENEKDAFYYKPLRAAQQSPYASFRDFGYWSPPFRLSKDDVEIITYTVPLMDSNGIIYGVLGIDITLDYLRKNLPYEELQKNSGSYLLAITEDGETFKNVLQVGPLYNHVVSKSGLFRLKKDKLVDGVYYIEDQSESEIATVSYFKLYDNNTPFENENWVLCGMTKKSILLKEATRLKNSLLISFVFAMIIGGLGSIIFSFTFTKPILELVNILKKSNPEKPIKLPKIHTKEIDELSETIEMFSNDITYYASRLSKIFQIMDLPLGTIEYNKITKKVWCTENVAYLMEFPENFVDQKYFTEHEFMQCIEAFNKKSKCISTKFAPHEVKVLEVNGKIKTSWLKIHIVDQEERILVALIDATDEIKEKMKIEYERDYDVLTHLLNRRSFKQKIDELLSGHISGVGAMVMWDLDNLKFINDTYGHDMGDKYIIESANVLSSLSGDGAIVARRSGDEFLAFIHGYQSKEEILDLIQKNHHKLYETVFYLPNNNNTKLRASAGIAWFPQDGTDYDVLVRHADFAMYSAKRTFKGSIKEFNIDSFKRDEVLFEGKEELNLFFELSLVRFAFQPIVDVKTGEIYAYEALMRPQSEKLKSVADVMRLARTQSKLYQMEHLTWTGAMKDFISQIEASNDAMLFINSVPNTRLTDIDFKLFEDKYKQYLKRLVVEIIESEQLDSECMETKFSLVHRWGINIALDDFGSGYNSESTLLYITPNFVKIDMSLIRDVDKDVERQNLISSMIKFIKTRNAKVIAEGVETREEMYTLISLGVDYIQGYYIGKPEFELKQISIDRKIELLEFQKTTI